MSVFNLIFTSTFEETVEAAVTTIAILLYPLKLTVVVPEPVNAVPPELISAKLVVGVVAAAPTSKGKNLAAPVAVK